MLIKSFQEFYYVFLVVPSLKSMLEVKSSQKLMVPSVPFIENVDISWKNQCFSHFSVIFIGCCMVKCVQLAFDLIWPPTWSPDLVPPEKHSKTLEIIFWAYWRYSGPVNTSTDIMLYGLTWRRQPWRFRHQRWRGGGRHGHRPATPRRRRSPISECRTLILHKYCSHFNSSRANDVIPSL